MTWEGTMRAQGGKAMVAVHRLRPQPRRYGSRGHHAPRAGLTALMLASSLFLLAGCTTAHPRTPMPTVIAPSGGDAYTPQPAGFNHVYAVHKVSEDGQTIMPLDCAFTGQRLLGGTEVWMMTYSNLETSYVGLDPDCHPTDDGAACSFWCPEMEPVDVR